MKTISCKIPAALNDSLTMAARREGVSKSEIVRQSLEAVLIKKNGKPSMHDLMKDGFGIVTDGPSDLSTNPKYMEDYGL